MEGEGQNKAQSGELAVIKDQAGGFSIGEGGGGKIHFLRVSRFNPLPGCDKFFESEFTWKTDYSYYR